MLQSTSEIDQQGIREHDFRNSHVAMLIDLSNGRERYDTIKER